MPPEDVTPTETPEVAPAPVEPAPIAPAPAQEMTPQVAPVETSTTPQAPDFRPPVEPTQQPNDLDYYRQTVSQLSQQLNQYRQQIEEAQLAGLEGDELAQAQQQLEYQRWQQERQAWEQQVQQWQQNQAISQMRTWAVQFVDDPTPLNQTQDPAQMAHLVATTQAAKIKKLEAEVAALRKGVQQPQGGPPVTTAGSPGTPTGKKRIGELTAAEHERLMQRAMMGLLRPDEYPAL